MKNPREWLIFKPIKDLYDMFFNNDQGFSWRKVGATAGLISAINIAFTISDEAKKIQAIEILLIFSGICIGLIAIPDLIKTISIIFKGKEDKDGQ